MRALRFDNALHLSTAEPDPSPAADEVLIKLRLAGICHTDLELTHGYMGFSGILGHEFVGELAHDAGPWQAGQRVVGEINIACGKCEFCKRGIPSQCSNRTTLGIDRYPGVFSDCLRLPIRNLYAVPDSVPDEVAVFAEPLAAALQTTELVHILPTDHVVLIGAGKLGLLIAQVLRYTGCQLTVIARQPHPIDLLKMWDIPYIEPSGTGYMPALAPRSADVVVDCTGSAEGFASALDLLKPRGTLVLKSTYVGLPQADLTRVVIDEIKIVGSRCGPFNAALRMMTQQQVDVLSMIDARYSLDDAMAAFEHASGRGVLKILLTP